MDPTEITPRLEALKRQMAEKYGTSGKTFAKQVRQIGRELPRYERKQAKVLVEAERFAGHPKMARRLQPAQLETAFRGMDLHLEGVDRAERIKGRIVSIAATVLFNLLLAVAGLAVVWWAFGG